MVWTLELEGEAERPGAIVPWNGAEGVSVNPEGESRHRLARAKVGKEGKRESNKNGREGKWECTQEELAEVQSPKRKVIRVDSEETQNCARESLKLEPGGSIRN